MKRWIKKWDDRVGGFMDREGLSDPYRRLIIICGMARTGTTALSAYLGSHPQVRLVVGGSLWAYAEHDILRGRIAWEIVDRLLAENPYPYRVLLKQPWLEGRDEMFRVASKAKFIICFRKKQQLLESWKRGEYSEESRKNPEACYQKYLALGEERVKQGAMRSDQERLGPSMAEEFGNFLGLDSAGFEASRIEKRWGMSQEEEWLKRRALWIQR